MKNQTKNDKLKEVLDGVECSMKKLHKDSSHHQKTSRISHNTIDQPHHVTAEEEPDYYDDEPDGKTFFLTTLLVPSLPCPTEESDPTELPLSRESIGFDMSWVKVVTSSSNNVKYSQLSTLLLLAVVISLNISKFCWIINGATNSWKVYKHNFWFLHFTLLVVNLIFFWSFLLQKTSLYY